MNEFNLPHSRSQILFLCYVGISVPMAKHPGLWLIMTQLLPDQDPRMQTSLLAAQAKFEKDTQ